MPVSVEIVVTGFEEYISVEIVALSSVYAFFRANRCEKS